MHDRFKVRCRALIIDNDELLVVQHSHTETYYSLPGGHLDYGEDPKTGMARELTEELGIHPEVGELVAVYTFQDARRNNEQSIEFYFVVENAEAYRNHESEIKSHAHEIGKVLWISQDNKINLLPSELYTIWKDNEIQKGIVHFISNV